MTDSRIATLDDGRVNERILAKESKADFRRVEAASVKRTTMLASAEGKRMFLRCFNSFQLNVHFISTIARMKLGSDDVEKVEEAIRRQLDEAKESYNKAIDQAEALFKANGISDLATYDTVPLQVEVGVISALGRRYFELIHKLDQVMPLLQTLEFEELVSLRDADRMRTEHKRTVIRMTRCARDFANGLRRRMDERDAMEGVTRTVPAMRSASAEQTAPNGPVSADDALAAGETARASRTPIETDVDASPDGGARTEDLRPGRDVGASSEGAHQMAAALTP